MNQEVKEFIFQELSKQDDRMHAITSQLGTKTGLYMVFSAFLFSGGVSLFDVMGKIGLSPNRALFFFSLLLSLVSTFFLLRASIVASYRVPPLGNRLVEQTEKYYKIMEGKNIPKSQRIHRIKGKFSNSLARSIRENFSKSEAITDNLSKASKCIAASIGGLLLATSLAAAQKAWPLFVFLCHLRRSF